MPDLDERENAILRQVLRDALASGRFKNKTQLARALKIAQPSLHEILEGGGASLATAKKVAKLFGPAYRAPGPLPSIEIVADSAQIDPRFEAFVRSGAATAEAAMMLGPFAGGAARRSDVEILTALKAAENAIALLADDGEEERPKKRRK